MNDYTDMNDETSFEDWPNPEDELTSAPPVTPPVTPPVAPPVAPFPEQGQPVVDPFAAAQPPAQPATDAFPQQPIDPDPVEQPDLTPNPRPLNVFAIANMPSFQGAEDDLQEIFTRVDIVLCLGNVDLNTLEHYKPDNIPGLVVIGGNDSQEVPPGFRALHGTGMKFREWLFAGLSGSTEYMQEPFVMTEGEATTLLGPLSPSDIFISNAFPKRLTHSGLLAEAGLGAIDQYILNNRVPYFFYAHPAENTIEEYGLDEPIAVGIGVNGFIELPNVKFVV